MKGAPMTTLHLQTYLHEGGGLEALAHGLAVRSARHPAYPNLVLFKYDQINSPMENPIVQECRGIILDEADDWRVIARPFTKFYNYGEPKAATIDWTTARVQEKVDGSLCAFYHYKGEWHVATTGTPDAGGRVHNGERLFRDLIWETAQSHGLELLSPAHTYLFELTSPYNRVVVPHGETRLTLLGIRHVETGAWVALEEASRYVTGTAPVVREFALDSFAALLASFDHLDPLTQEGYVVVDGQGQRVKVKHPRYVALHLLRESAHPRAYVEVLQAGETPELLTYFPELGVEYAPIRSAYEALITEIDADYARLRNLEMQKDFAQAALQTRCSAALFNIRASKCANARDYLSHAQTAMVMRLLGLKELEMKEAKEFTET